MPRRHAIVVLNLPVPDDRRVWAQATALRDAGVSVTVLCPAMRGHRPGRRQLAGIDVRYLHTIEGRGVAGTVVEGAWNTAVVLAWLPWLLARRISSLQVCNPPDTLFPVLLAARTLGVHCLYDQHDLSPAMASARPGFERLRPLLELFERATVRAAHRVVTTSDEQRRRLATRYGVSATVVRSAPHAAPDVGATAPPAVPGDGVRLGYLGVVGEQEGLVDLLDAVALLRRRGVAVTVGIAGEGPYLPDARRHAEDLGLGDAVTFTGWLQDDELEAFLAGLSAMVVSDPESEYNHHCAMNKVIEAMARAMPIVLRPLRENLNLTGAAGWVARGWSTEDLAEAIEDCYRASPDERAAVGARLRERYEDQLAWPREAARYVEVVTGSRR